MVIASMLAPKFERRGVAFAQLPVIGGCDAEGARAVSRRAIGALAPQVVVHLGEARTRSRISFERVAINLRDSSIADNAGVWAKELPVIEGGPAAYFATLPLRELQLACDQVGVAQETSLSAGSFLCNEVMYASLHDIAIGNSRARCSGFIHVPQLPEQMAARGGPCMAASDAARAIDAVLECLLADKVA